MKALRFVALVALLAGCWSFEDALSQCRAPGGRCHDAGAAAGGGGAGGGLAGGSGGGVGGASGGGGGGGDDAGAPDGGAPDAGPPAQWRFLAGMFDPTVLVAVHAVSPNEVWVGGRPLRVAQWNGTSLVEGYSPGLELWSITHDSTGVVFGGEWGGGGGVKRRDAGVAFTPGESVSGKVFTNQQVYSVFTAGSQTWAVGDAAEFYRAPSWATVPLNPPANIFLVNGAWGRADDDFWIAVRSGSTGGGLHHWAGAWVTSLPAPAQLMAVWGAPGGEVWAVGLASQIWHVRLDGGVETLDAGAMTSWNAVWGTSDDDVFIVGGANLRGVATHWDGRAFTRTDVSSRALFALHGLGPEDVYAVDADGGLWRYSR